MELLDFEFEIPKTMRVERASSEAGGICIDIVGDDAGQLPEFVNARETAVTRIL